MCRLTSEQQRYFLASKLAGHFEIFFSQFFCNIYWQSFDTATKRSTKRIDLVYMRVVFSDNSLVAKSVFDKEILLDEASLREFLLKLICVIINGL